MCIYDQKYSDDSIRAKCLAAAQAREMMIRLGHQDFFTQLERIEASQSSTPKKTNT